MRSRSPLILVALLLAGPLAPLADASHTDEGSWSASENPRRRILFDPYTVFDAAGKPKPYCTNGDALNYQTAPVDPDGPDGQNATGIAVIYRDAVSGLETWFYYLPDPIRRGDGTPIVFPESQADCEIIDRATERIWRTPAGAPPFKVGDKFRFKVWYHNPGSTSGCPPLPAGGSLTSRTGPGTQLRINSTELGVATGMFSPVKDTDPRTNPRNIVTILDAHNPGSDDGWFTVPAPGTPIPGGGTVPEFDRVSPLGSDTFPFTIDTYYTCPSQDQQATVVQKAQRQLVHGRLDNVAPEVYVRASHALPATPGQNPAPPEQRAWTSPASDLFSGIPNATISRHVSFEVTICDPDFDPDDYTVRIDFRSLNASYWQNRSHKLEWSSRFVQAADRTGCLQGTSSLPARWVLNRTVEVADATLDLGWNGPAGTFDYRGLSVTVGDEVSSGWVGSRGNLKEVNVALNVDAVRPAGPDLFTATPLPGGLVRLDWNLPSGPANAARTLDLRALEITARALDDPTVTRSVRLRNGTTQVRSLFETNPCTGEVNLTSLPASTRTSQWLERPPSAGADLSTRGDLPTCLILPDPLLAPWTLPLGAGGVSRLYEFSLVTRDDAGLTPISGVSDARWLDALQPVITPISFENYGARRLEAITVGVTDDTLDSFGRPDLVSVTVSVTNGTLAWKGGRWQTGTPDALALARQADGTWSVKPGLTGSGGNLTLTVVAQDRAGNIRTLVSWTVLDIIGPSILAENSGVVPQGQDFEATVIGRLRTDGDEGTGVRRIDVRLQNASGVLTAFATWCDRCNVPGASPLAAQGPWVLRLPTGSMPLGVYNVTIEAQDGAGNSMRIRRAANLTIAPRGEIFRDPGTPYVSGTLLSAVVYAGYHGARNAVGTLCPADGSRRVCAPEVAIDGLSTVGSWREVARRTTPDHPNAPSGGRFLYTFDDVEVGNLGPSPQLRLRVVTPNATLIGLAVETKTPDSEGVIFAAPLNRWAPGRWGMTDKPADYTFQARLSNAGASAVGVRYRIDSMAPGAPSGSWETATADGALFTWKLGDRPDGEYLVHVCPVTTGNETIPNPSCLYPLARRVGVEKDAPTMSATLQGVLFTSAVWTSRSAVLEGEVVTGFDNVTSSRNLTLVGLTPAGVNAIASVKAELLTTNPAADRYAFRITAQLANTLPSEGELNLRLTVVTETGRSVVLTRTVKLDPAAPAIALVPLAEGTPAELRGWANDTLSGTTSVKVTLTRDDGKFWDGTGWAAGPATSRTPTLSCTGGACQWVLGISGAVTLDSTGRVHTVQVAATDVAGNSAVPLSASRRFDTTAPSLATPSAPGGTRVAGGDLTLDLKVEDALSGVQSVTATIRRPGGAVEELPLTLAAGTHRNGTWRLSLGATHLPYGGSYGIRLQAVDGGENLRELAQFPVAVADDGPPVFEVVEVTPNPAEAWAGALLAVRIRERTGLSYVQVNVTRPGESTGWRDLTPVTVDPVSGAGTYRLSTLALLPLVRGSAYDVVFRTGDAAHGEIQRTVTLTVSANDRPRIHFLHNLTGETPWVRAEPHLVWEVIDDNPVTTTIWPELVVGGVVRNLTADRQVTAIPGGLRVAVHVAPALPAGAPVVVRLKVQDAGLAVNSSEVTVRVDAAGPALIVTADGVVDRPGIRYATAATVVNVTAVDAGSGLAFLESSLDNATWVPGPRNLTLGEWAGLAAGNVTLQVRARDHAGNPSNAEVVYAIDKTGPQLVALEVGRRVKLAAEDDGIGVADGTVRLHVRNATGGQWRAIPLLPNGTAWEAILPPSVSGGYVWYAEALDRAGNARALGTSAAPRTGFTHNLAPFLQLPGLPNGTRVRGTVALLWVAEDPEGREVAINLTARSGARFFPLLVPANVTSAEWDTTVLPDGEALLRLTASDGVATSVIERRLVVSNAAQAGLAPAPASSPAGATLLLSLDSRANLTLSNGTGTIQRQLGGTWVPVGQAPLRREGSRLLLEYAPQVPGKYRILLEVQYDGVAGMESLIWGPVEVAATAPPVAPAFSPAFLAVVVAVILLVGAAAVAAWRWRT